MTVSLNGESADAGGASTVQELIDHYNLPAASILVEHNGAALHRRQWPETLLRDGDRIEFIRVVAGG